MTTVYYTATSLDGFIADPEASLEWLLSKDTDEDGPLGYNPFIADVGALAMGATTFTWVMRHLAASDEPSSGWPYAQPTWVFTHRSPETMAIPEGSDVRLAQGDVAAVHAQMVAAAGGKDVWIVGGGDLAGQFADAGLLDEIVVAIAPVTLGAGAPLLPRRLDLTLVEVARNRDFACARYAVTRA